MRPWFGGGRHERVDVRPPRPVHVDPELIAEAAAQTHMRPHEVINVRDLPEGRVITTKDGASVIIVPEDRPDAWGQTGVLAYGTPERPVPPNLAIPTYAPPGSAYLHGSEPTGDPWALADLDLAASRENPPAPAGTHRPYDGYLTFTDADPATLAIRARAVWLQRAKTKGVSPQIYAQTSDEARQYREIILASGLLSDEEAAKL